MTSIVKEYSILYTNRVHQKTKNWKDGELKYYLFNNRIDVHGENGELVASDFFPPNKSREKIEQEYFESGNQFKLPNASILVEVDEKTGEYERDISIMFKKKNQAAGGAISQGSPSVSTPEIKIKYESDEKISVARNIITPLSPRPLIPDVKRRPIGLSRRGAERPKNSNVKEKANIKIESLNLLLMKNAVPPKRSRPSRKDVRIPVNSSSVFKHLGLELDRPSSGADFP